MLGNDSAHGHPDAYAHVPRREIGARGGGALVVARKVDVEGVHGGEHRAEAYAKQYGHDEKHG